MINTEIFIERCNVIYGYKYDYSLVNYTHSKNKVEIICNEHGIFKKRADMHLSGYGCPKCASPIKIESNRYNTETFILAAIRTHDNRYDYSLTEYSHNKIKIKIKCNVDKEHGVFEQLPLLHLKYKIGCPKCAKNYKYSTNEFIEKANLIHNYFYIYTKTEYIKSMQPVIITCPIHGDFKQNPNSHIIAKNGCKKCANANNGFTEQKYLKIAELGKYTYSTIYVLKCFNEYENFYKIGITFKEIKQRYASKKSMPYQYEVVASIRNEPSIIYQAEKKLLIQYKKYHYTPLIKFGGSTKECFTNLPDLETEILNLQLKNI